MSDRWSLLRQALVTVLVLVAAVAVIGGVGGLLTAPGVVPAVELLIGLALSAALIRMVSTRRLLAGWSVLVYIGLFVPIVFVIVFAFNAGVSASVFSGFSLRWFATAFGEPPILASLALSFRIALCSALISVGLGTAAALALARAKLKVRVPYEAVLFLTLVIPELMVAIGLLLFFVFFGFQLGASTIMIGHAAFGASLVTLIVRARFVGMGNALELASFDLGAGPAATFRQVTLPRLAPAVVVGFLLAFTFSFDDVVVSQFVSGSNDTTWPLYIYSALRFGIKPDINATATVMFVITIGLLATAGLVYRRMSRSEASTASS